MDSENISENTAVQYYGSIRALARVLGLSHQTLTYRAKRGAPVITAEEAVALEEITDGELKRSALRPDLWD